MRRRLFDRSDGYRLRKADPFFKLIPHIMPKRSDAQVFFEDRIYLEECSKLIRQLRNEGYKAGFLHIVIASIVRTMSQRPKINRFVVGRKTYARKDISISLAVKKEMNEHSEETTIKVTFDPKDTIYDVIEKMNTEINNNKGLQSENDTDKFAKIITFVPNFMIAFLMGIIRFLDNHGLLPKFILKLSPFHCSAFITDVGSLGIKPLYHHIYDLGSTTIFIAFGTRAKEQVIEDDMNVLKRKAMDIKVVADERVVDGYYFATALKMAKKLMTNPEALLTPPEEVIVDNEI